MNLRDIKKDIEYFVGAFVDDCALFLSDHSTEKGAATVAGLIDKAVELYNGLRDKVGTPEGNKKVYYNKLREELLSSLDGLYGELSEAIKGNA